MSHDRRIGRFVDALLRDRRPPRFEADPDEARVLQAAASLRGARTAGDLPTVDFVRDLETRLRTEMETQPAAPERTSRRGFLIGGGIAAAAAAGVAVDLGLRHPAPTPAPDQTQGELVPAGSTWQQVATLSDLTTGRPHLFQSGSVVGVLVRDGAGTVHALSAVCTHMGCLLTAGDGELLCPCHGASFSLDGVPRDREYLTTPLPKLRSRIVGESVQVLV